MRGREAEEGDRHAWGRAARGLMIRGHAELFLCGAFGMLRGELEVGVADALVVHSVEEGDESLLDLSQVGEGEAAFIELGFFTGAVRYPHDGFVHLGGFGVGVAAYRGLDDVSEHDEGCFAGIGSGAGVAVVFDANGLSLGFLLGAVVEVAQYGVAVMLGDDGAYGSSEAVFFFAQ